MLQDESITTVMSTDPVSVSIDRKVSDVQRVLGSERIHHVPVVEGDVLVGMISTTDMMRLSFAHVDGDDPTKLPVLDNQFSLEHLMHRNVVALREDATVQDAARALATGDFHALPVVDDGRRLVGIVTSTDLIRYLLALY